MFSGAGLKVTVRLKPVCKPFGKMSKMTKKDARKILKKESDEIAALKSELRQVKMERDILKKSLTLFGPSKTRRKQ